MQARLFVTRNNAHSRFLAQKLVEAGIEFELLIENTGEGGLKKIKTQFLKLYRKDAAKGHHIKGVLNVLLYATELPILAIMEAISESTISKLINAPSEFPKQIKAHHIKHINDPQTHLELKHIQPTSAIIYGTSIIGKTSLELMGKVANCHMGIVPQYRGAKSEFWALLNGEDHCIGHSIHECVVKLDAGRLLRQEFLHKNTPTYDSATIKTKVSAAFYRAQNLKVLGAHLPKTWMLFEQDKLKRISQEGEAKLYSTPRLKNRLKLVFKTKSLV